MPNWSNCPLYENCTDKKKAIMTYCDIGCSQRSKMTDKLTLEEEAVEAMARHSFRKNIRLLGFTEPTFDTCPQAERDLYLQDAKELLNLKGKCPNPYCINGQQYVPGEIEQICPICHGTGEGERPLLVRAGDQKLPRNKMSMASKLLYATAHEAQQDMIKGDETGHFVKVRW